MTLNFEAEVNVPFDFDVEALAGEVINAQQTQLISQCVPCLIREMRF